MLASVVMPHSGSLSSVPYQVWVVTGAAIGVVTVAGYIERRWKVLKGWWAIREAKNMALFGVAPIRVNGVVVRDGVPSMLERLTAGDAHFAAIDRRLIEISDDLIGRNGKPLAQSVGELTAVVSEHVRDTVIHKGA